LLEEDFEDVFASGLGPFVLPTRTTLLRIVGEMAGDILPLPLFLPTNRDTGSGWVPER